LVKKNTGEAIFRKETQLLGQKGDRALNETPKENQEADLHDPSDADLLVDPEAFSNVQKSVNDYIRKSL